MSNLFDLASSLTIVDGDSYVISYPYLLSFFSARETFTPSEFVCGSHMVYGWMPTILDLYPDEPNIDLNGCAQLLTRVKAGGSLLDEEVVQLADVMNNSLVGASKLLHFVAPDRYAIWDSRIYTYLYKKKPHHYQVSNIKKYREYHNILDSYRKDARFHGFHETVNKKIGYPVSDLRALELVMFQNSAAIGV